MKIKLEQKQRYINKQENYNRIEKLINNLCGIVLTKNDDLDFSAIRIFIDNLSDDDKSVLNLEELDNDSTIRSIIQKQITNYLESYSNFNASNSVRRPFEFDNGGKYKIFYEYCKKYYRDKNNNVPFPHVIDFTLNYIQEISEHYKIFGCFYEVRAKETASNLIDELAEVAAQKTQDAIKLATKESAKTAVEEALASKMNDVTKNVSETSVTILGIFATIVLTIVAGLIYSSSVLNSINSANFCRLISVCALVGFVCYSLVALMFRYIERIKYKNDEMPKFNKLSIAVSIILLLIMLVFGGLQYCDFNNCYEETIEEETMTTSQDNEKGQED